MRSKTVSFIIVALLLTFLGFTFRGTFDATFSGIWSYTKLDQSKLTPNNKQKLDMRMEEKHKQPNMSQQAVPAAYTVKAPVPIVFLETKEQQMRAGNTLRGLLERHPNRYQCSHIKEIPNYKSTDSWKVCLDSTYRPQNPCLVYSVGVNWDFAFEDAMEKLGCTVESFDPSMDTSDHRHSRKITFHNVGLSHEDVDNYSPRIAKGRRQWKMRTLASLLEENKHTGRTIDILKYDIETSEWNVTRNLVQTGVLKNIKQLLLEWHIFSDTPERRRYQELIDILRDLEHEGFHPFYVKPHGCVYNWKNFNLQSDMGYVNINFTK